MAMNNAMLDYDAGQAFIQKIHDFLRNLAVVTTGNPTYNAWTATQLETMAEIIKSSGNEKINAMVIKDEHVKEYSDAFRIFCEQSEGEVAGVFATDENGNTILIYPDAIKDRIEGWNAQMEQAYNCEFVAEAAENDVQTWAFRAKNEAEAELIIEAAKAKFPGLKDVPNKDMDIIVLKDPERTYKKDEVEDYISKIPIRELHFPSEVAKKDLTDELEAKNCAYKSMGNRVFIIATEDAQKIADNKKTKVLYSNLVSPDFKWDIAEYLKEHDLTEGTDFSFDATSKSASGGLMLTVLNEKNNEKLMHDAIAFASRKKLGKDEFLGIVKEQDDKANTHTKCYDFDLKAFAKEVLGTEDPKTIEKLKDEIINNKRKMFGFTESLITYKEGDFNSLKASVITAALALKDPELDKAVRGNERKIKDSITALIKNGTPFCVNQMQTKTKYIRIDSEKIQVMEEGRPVGQLKNIKDLTEKSAHDEILNLIQNAERYGVVCDIHGNPLNPDSPLANPNLQKIICPSYDEIKSQLKKDPEAITDENIKKMVTTFDEHFGDRKNERKEIKLPTAVLIESAKEAADRHNEGRPVTRQREQGGMEL